MAEYEKNIVEPERPPMAIRRLRLSRCVLEAANTHSQYVTVIAFPLQ